MATIVVTQFISLDGVVEAPGGEPGYAHTGWVSWTPGDDHFAYKLEETLTHDALLIGRKTYESFAGAWPSRSGEFADKVNSMPKYVVSRTLTRVDWNNSSLVHGDVPAAVVRLKQSLPGNILVAGSRTLVATLMAHDLVDEYRLMIFPVVLGSGARLFADSPDAHRLRLTHTQSFPTGVVVLTYEPLSRATA